MHLNICTARSADLHDRAVLDSREPAHIWAMACALDLARLRPLSLGLSHELSRIVWFLYLTSIAVFSGQNVPPLSPLLGYSVQTPCGMLVLCVLSLVYPTKAPPPQMNICSSSAFDPFCPRIKLLDTWQSNFQKDFSLRCICVYPYIYQLGTDLLNTSTTSQHFKRCFVLWLPYLTMMLLKSQILEQQLRCLPSLSSSPSINQIIFSLFLLL